MLATLYRQRTPQHHTRGDVLRLGHRLAARQRVEREYFAERHVRQRRPLRNRIRAAVLAAHRATRRSPPFALLTGRSACLATQRRHTVTAVPRTLRHVSPPHMI